MTYLGINNKPKGTKIMKINVILLGLGFQGEIREVETPKENYENDIVLCCDAFKYGQNEFQPSKTQRSVSVGDVILVDENEYHEEEYYRVLSFEFKKMTKVDFETYKKQAIQYEIDRDNIILS
jgi:hypothetical protein